MKGRFLPMLVMLFAVSGLLFTTLPSDSSDAAGDGKTYVSGLICEIGQSGPTPAKNIPVALIYDGTTFTGKTGSDGYFKIKINDGSTVDTSKKVYFDFSLSGYSIFTLPDTMTTLDPNSNPSSETITAVATIDLTTITPVDGVYCATSDAQHCILIGDTYVPVTFTVTNASTGVAVRNADVTLKCGNMTYRGTTDYEGVCTFSTGILIGTYEVTIKCDGYVTFEEVVQINKSATFKTDFEMTQKEPITYLGMTLYHLLMILGVTIGLCLVVISYVLCRRTWRNVDKKDVD